MVSYMAFRPHNWNISLRERVSAAVAAYRRAYGTTPVGIAVNPREVEDARRAVAALGMDLEVQTVGGCLAPEVWLVIDKTDVHNEGGA